MAVGVRSEMGGESEMGGDSGARLGRIARRDLGG